MVKINSIETILVSSNYGNGKVYGQPKSVKTIALIKLKTNKNIYGIGETYSGIYSPELVVNVVDFLKPLILGKKIDENFDINSIKLIPFIASTGLVKSVISGLEIAYYDLLGKLFKKPIYKLLKPQQNKHIGIKTYCSGGSVIFKEDEIAREVEYLLKQGFKSYKMRVGYYSQKKDLLRIKSAKNILGKNNNLMIDAIMGTHKNKWSYKKAYEFIKITKSLYPLWIEEPLNPLNLYDMSRLQKSHKTHLAFGESFTSYEEFKNAMHLNCSKYLQPDVTHCGYIDAIKLMNDIKINNFKIAIHVWGSKISLISNLHFATAFNKKIDFIEIPNVRLSFLEHEFRDIMEIKNGKILINEEVNGLGIVLSEKILKKYKFIKASGFKI